MALAIREEPIMKKSFALLSVVILAMHETPRNLADESSHRKAAERLFVVMDAEKTFKSAIESIEKQSKEFWDNATKQNEKIAKVHEAGKKLQVTSLSYEGIKS